VASNLPDRLVVGFDLDMTLIDPRRGVRSAMSKLASETGAPIDVDYIADHLGPPLEMALAPWFADERLEQACARYRKLREAVLETETEAIPGAVEAVAAVRELEGRVVVVTAKYEPHAIIELRAVGIDVDAVVGWRYGAQKGVALLEHGAHIYVGDHPADVVAARTGKTVSVVVASGGSSADDLRAAGPDVALSSLFEFPRWLTNWLLERS
jgi:phosphoglycolate phosphatase